MGLARTLRGMRHHCGLCHKVERNTERNACSADAEIIRVFTAVSHILRDMQTKNLLCMGEHAKNHK